MLAAASPGPGTASAIAATPNAPHGAEVSAADPTYGRHVVTGRKGEVCADPGKRSHLQHVLPQGREILCSNAPENGFRKIGTSQWIKDTDLARIS